MDQANCKCSFLTSPYEHAVDQRLFFVVVFFVLEVANFMQLTRTHDSTPDSTPDPDYLQIPGGISWVEWLTRQLGALGLAGS